MARSRALALIAFGALLGAAGCDVPVPPGSNGAALERPAAFGGDFRREQATELVATTLASLGVDPARVQVTLEVREAPLGACDRGGAVASDWEATSGRHRVVVFPAALGRGRRQVEGLLRHEAVHVAHRELAGPSVELLPRWVREGLASVLAGEGEHLLLKSVIAVAESLDPRATAAAPEWPAIDALRGWLMLGAALGQDRDMAATEALALLALSDPLPRIAALLDCPPADVARLCAERGAARWRRRFREGWALAGYVREQIAGAPPTEARAALERFAGDWPRSPHLLDLRCRLLARLDSEGAAAEIPSLLRLIAPDAVALPDRTLLRVHQIALRAGFDLEH